MVRLLFDDILLHIVELHKIILRDSIVTEQEIVVLLSDDDLMAELVLLRFSQMERFLSDDDLRVIVE